MRIIAFDNYSYLVKTNNADNNCYLVDTKLNLLYNVGFNKEVGEDAALYWSKTPGFLKDLLERVDKFTSTQINNMGKKAKQRVIDGYSWKKIVNDYENTFLGKIVWKN